MSDKAMIPATAAAVVRYSGGPDELLGNIARNYAARFTPELATPEGQTRFIEALRSVVSAPAIGNGPSLMDCLVANPESLCNVVATALGLGLDLHPSRGEIYMIPRLMKVRDDKGGKPEFRPTVTMIVGYKGLAKAAKVGGHIVDVWSRMVFPGEVFEIQEGTDPCIHHVPQPFASGRTLENSLGVYAVAMMPDGRHTFEVFNREQIQKRREMGAPGGGWSKWPEEMAMKGPLRRLIMSRGWLSAGLVKLLALEDETETALRLSTPPMPRALPRQAGPSMLAAETANEVALPFTVDESEPAPLPYDVASPEVWAAYDVAHGKDAAELRKLPEAHARNRAAKLAAILSRINSAEGVPPKRPALLERADRAEADVPTKDIEAMRGRLRIKDPEELGDAALLGYVAALLRPF